LRQVILGREGSIEGEIFLPICNMTFHQMYEV